MTYLTKLRQATPFGFGSDIVPSKHLKQFSSRIAGSGSGALAGTVTFSAGAITAIALTDGGANYSSTTTRVLITGDGTGAAATATIVGGEITGFTVTAGGTGYTSATVHIVDGPVVVLAGDSLSTETPTGGIVGSSLWYLMTTAIRAANPRRNITFFNRGIGAQTWTSFNDVANANLPAWYSEATKPWITYIEELKPDLVVCAFGMNDRENFVFAQMTAAVNKLLAFSQEPDVVLATTMVPSAISDTETISGAVAQNGRDATSAYIRSTAINRGFGLLDLNRRSRLVRDGLDVRNIALRRRLNNSTQAMPWTATNAAQGDFAINATFSAVASWAGQTITIPLGTTGANTVTELLIDDNAGYVRITVRDRSPSTSGTTNQDQVTTTLASPTGTVEIEVIALDNSLSVAINDAVIYADNIARFSGEFTPSITTAISWGSAAITYSGGQYARYAPRSTDAELWGDSDLGYGGNELNHPSSIGVALMVAPVIYEADWSHIPVSIGNETNGLTTNIGIGEPDPLARFHVTKTPMAVPTPPTATANTALFADASASGITVMTDDGGVCRIFMGDASDPNQWEMNYAHSSDVFTENHGATTVRTVTATIQAFGVPIRLPSYTVAGLPGAGAVAAGGVAFVTDESGGAVMAFSDGANWRRATDRAVVS